MQGHQTQPGMMKGGSVGGGMITQFNGVDDYVRLPIGQFYDAGTGNNSLHVKMHFMIPTGLGSLDNSSQPVVTLASGVSMYMGIVLSGRIYLQVRGTNLHNITPIVRDFPYEIEWWYDGANAYVYVNGTQYGGAKSTNLVGGTADTEVCGRADGVTSFPAQVRYMSCGTVENPNKYIYNDHSWVNKGTESGGDGILVGGTPVQSY